MMMMMIQPRSQGLSQLLINSIDRSNAGIKNGFEEVLLSENACTAFHKSVLKSTTNIVKEAIKAGVNPNRSEI